MEDKTIIVEDDRNQPRLNDVAKQFIADCIAEKKKLTEDFPVAIMLLDEAIAKICETGRIPGRELYADVFNQKFLKITQKVHVPTKLFPNFNFVGKILGPKGNTLRNLQKETLCRIVIKGRKSMRDANKEEELRESEDHRHAHLKKNLYIEISTVASPIEAHARIAYALAEIRKYLIPDSNDEVSQMQRKDILADPELAKKASRLYGSEREDEAALNILNKVTTPKAEIGEFTENTNTKGTAKKKSVKRSLQEHNSEETPRSLRPRRRSTLIN